MHPSGWRYSHAAKVENESRYRSITGYKILELAGIGPGLMAGMVLGDMGALETLEVVHYDLPGHEAPLPRQFPLPPRRPGCYRWFVAHTRQHFPYAQ